MDTNDQTTTLANSPITVKNGGVQRTVSFIDGTSEDVKVLQTPLTLWEKYYDTLPNIWRFVEFVTAKPEKWAENLSDASLYEIDTVGKQINDPRYDRLLRRQVETVENQQPVQKLAARLTSISQTQ